MAPGGTPRLLIAMRVNSLGSSHQLTYFSLTSLAIFRFDKTVPVMLRRPYSLCIGSYTFKDLFSHSYETRDWMNSVVHRECVIFSKLSQRQWVKS